LIELRGYIDENGNKRFAKWFDGLDAIAAAKVTIALTRMEQGNFSNVKGVGGGVLEYKIDFGPGYRIYFRQGRGTPCDPDWRRNEETPRERHRGGEVVLD
jgi:putative addiction module killer protein